jgi:phosphatidylglycerol:prolipoprotein diacylglycerol transferase
MHPILASCGPVTVYSYGLALVAAFTTATLLAARAARTWPAGPAPIAGHLLSDCCAVTLLGGLLGARAVYVLLRWEEFATRPLEVFAIWHGGLVWSGGFAGGLLAGWAYLRARRLALLPVVDQLIPFVVLGHAIGRIGCFFNGCCYGRPTQGWCAVQFPGFPGPVVPTQLLEAAGLVMLFLLLRGLQRPTILRRPGRLLGLYLIGYAALRVPLEGLRGDQAIWRAGLTLQQAITLGLAAVGIVLLGRRAR